MTRSEFTRAVRHAEAMRRAGDRPHYWRGYVRGIRRAYHGERFGTPEEHARWYAMAGEDDPDRQTAGRGYRDGLKGGAQ